MRGPFIWAPINIGDWKAAVEGLTHEEEAVVLRLLLAFWGDGEWPSDHLIPRRTGLSPKKWLAMQEHVGAAIGRYLERSGFMDERTRAAKTSAERQRAAYNRWGRYRANATQGLDANACANADPNAMPTTTTLVQTYTDRAEKPTAVKGLSDDRDGQEAAAPKRPNGRGWH